MPNNRTRAHTIDHGSMSTLGGNKSLASPIIDQNDSIRVFIVGESHIVRSGLRRILENVPALHVLGDVSLKEASVECVSHSSPDLVLIDLDSHNDDVLACIGALHEASEKFAVLIMIELADHELAQKALTHGASGIVLKMQPPAVLVTAIRELCKVHRHNSTPTSGVRRDRQIANGGKLSDSGTMAKLQSLTARERDIIGLIGFGMKNKDIANRLSISDITVRHHLTSIFCKLEVEDRQKLLILAHRYGLIDLALSIESA
jgi:DNA-binding NarL/FixJ family response regulator